VEVGGELWLGIEAIPWLIGALKNCIETLKSSETEIGADTLRVKEKGHEFDPQVGIGNQRAGVVEHTGRYFIAIREDVARDLVDQLQLFQAFIEGKE
jgi:hypothetical protein